ncbi:MAG: cupin-like domain-containing protein [Rickettsiales bacterium]|nr:cupin-like domain-containing protein [Rickettsiales bacterium]
MDHHLQRKNCKGDICRFLHTSGYKDIAKLLKHEMPFIIRNLSHDWPARKIWDLEYLNNVVGEKAIRIGKLNKNNVVSYDSIETQRMYDFLQYLKHYQNTPKKLDLNKIYLITSRLAAHEKARDVHLPELLKDIEVPCFIPYNKLWEINLWMGIGGNRSNLHFDPEENLLTMIKGSKNIVLFPPISTKFLYQNNTKKTKTLESHVNIFNLDRKMYPLVDHAIYYQTHLIEGESLYIPSGWWHAVESSQDINIAINFWWLVKYYFLFKVSNPSAKRLWQKDNKWLTVLMSEFYFYN